MRRKFVSGAALFTLLTIAVQAKEDTLMSNTMMFIGAVVHPQCTTKNFDKILELNCQSHFGAEWLTYRFDITKLLNSPMLHDNYKSIKLLNVKEYSSLVNVIITYD